MRTDIVSPTGARYAKVGKLPPGRAKELVRESDALVAYDGCGCGGYCEPEWFTGAALKPFIESGAPRIKPGHAPVNSLSEWRDSEGRPLILAEGGVRWARQLADRP